MNQIKEINCIYEEKGTSLRKRYVGDLIVSNNSKYFEGILIDISTNRCFLAFGHYKDGKFLNMIKGVCDREDEYPTEFHLKIKDNLYKGEVSIRSSFADFPIGNSETRLFTASKSEKKERETLQSKIAELKSKMNKETSCAYSLYMPNLKKEKNKIFSLR